MKVGIVGHEALKFTPDGERKARGFISHLLRTKHKDAELVSGACHLGGIDVWAEEIADALPIPKHIYPPRTKQWSTGYKPRNVQIAEASDIVYVLVVDVLPDDWQGMRFKTCYHCHDAAHVKSGGCWTGHVARRLGKPVTWQVIPNAVETAGT
jgi:hypothetical protein